MYLCVFVICVCVCVRSVCVCGTNIVMNITYLVNIHLSMIDTHHFLSAQPASVHWRVLWTVVTV